MDEKKLKEANETADKKAAELSAELGVKVHPIVFQDSETSDCVVGYLKEPNRMVKLAVMDKQLAGMFSAAAEMYELILVKEHSDPRLWSENPEHDKFYLGGVRAAQDLIKMSINQSAAKKNS